MRKIFYYTDVLPFLSREKEAIEKLKRNLQVFKASSGEVHLVWHPWTETEAYLKINKSGVVEEYRNIVDEYSSAGWGEFDTSDSYEAVKEVLLGCDGYYGDPSDLAYEAQHAKIPVMFQNLEI